MSQTERDYLLGTHDVEIERLGLQHRVWRPRVLDAWRRAGITLGSTVMDAGAGPGWASLDLAEIVGAQGRVHALERSNRFLDFLSGAARSRGLDNITRHETDLVTDALPIGGMDAIWVRWVLAFVSDPKAVLEKLVAALKPGGVIVIHEYLDYGTWSFAPWSETQEAFRKFVESDWRATGGEPDIARHFPTLLPEVGLKIRSLTPIVDVVTPDNFVWHWPASFARTYPQHLADVGKVDQGWADKVVAEFNAAEARGAVMVTPMVLETIAERV